jgi:hypothetical protein
MQGGPRIRHLDDLPWIEVSKIRLADGRIVGIKEKWLEMSPRFIAFYNVRDPGAITPPHGHTGDHGIYIVEGSVSSPDGEARAGSHIMLEWGDVFGPWTAGPDGCVMFGWIAGNGMPYFDKERWRKHLVEIGAEELPTPMPPMPIWVGSGDVLPKTE